MTPASWATIPTRLRANSQVRLLRLCLLAASLLLLAGSVRLAALPAADPGEELARLAGALRQDPSPANYQALARFAAAYAESELNAQASFALGMADFEAERWQAARDRFLVGRGSAVLRDHANLYRARAEIEQGALEAARAPLLELFSPENPLNEAARVLEADRRLRSGQASAAVEWLERQPDLQQRPALLFALAQARRAAGNPLAATESLHRIYFEFPLSPQAEAANQLLAELREGELKGNYPAPGEALRRARAEKLWALGAYRGARSAYVDLSVRAGEPVRSQARVRAAWALYQLGEPDAACRELERIGSVPSGVEGEFRAFRVRCALRADRAARVENELAALAAATPRDPWYAEALLAAGHTALARGDAGRARELYQRVVDAFPSGDAAAQAHWRLAWLAYQSRDASASRLLEEHLEKFPESTFLPRALYWRARTALAAGAQDLARRLLAWLRDYAPRDYLAQQAEQWAGDLRGAAGDPPTSGWELSGLKAARVSAAASAGETPAPVRAQLETAAALARLGFGELAGETLDAAARLWPGPEVTVAQARLALEQGSYARATEILQRAFPNYWRYRLEELPRESWETLFPRPYWDLIEREAKRQGLDPYLVAALIRQESRFEQGAVSSAGARGLMQLMPATARRLAGAPRLPPDRLHDPELNIRLGTRFLAELLRRFDGNLEKTVAGYNAGGTRVEGWASQGAYAEPAEFVESIPVTQTREFVYTVLRNYRFYRDLYAAEDARATGGTSVPRAVLASPPLPE